MIQERAEQKQQKAIPKGVAKFITKAIVIFIAWQLLYDLILQPSGIPDKALTQVVLSGTVQMLSVFYSSVQQVGNSILIGGKPSINIEDACNGLELIALYLGYLIILPSNWKRMASYILIGVVAIYFLNIVRCSLLAYLFQHDISTANFAHKYAFKLVVYAFVFAGWMSYSKNVKNAATKN
jgi:exosortase/archaeosortase family protein